MKAHADPKGHPLAGRTILQIIPDMEAGGAERTTIDIAEALNGIGARALVATTGGRLIGELQTKGGIWLPFPAKTKNPARMLLNIGKLSRLIKREGVEIVHARSRAPAWVALAAARAAGIGFVTTYHGSYAGTSAAKVLYNSVMARGDVTIANSHYTADLIRQQHRIDPTRLRVIHRGTDMRAFAPVAVARERVEAMRRSWLIGQDQRVVLLAARLTAWKGQKQLIEAAKTLRDRGIRDAVFVLAGDPQGRESYVRELDSRITELNLGSIVRRVGHVSDMPAAFLAASVVTVPSTEPEAFGRVAVEAQAMGTPVVVSDLGAVPETVLSPPAVRPEHGTGWRVPPGDPVALADAIEAALGLRPSARDMLAARARAHVEAQFSLEKMVGDTLDVYTALLQARRDN
jgi:glycosyltransferase involved in cell wall biosynthesis